MGASVKFTVFTKPWKMSIAELGPYVRSLGFEGIELPVRPGYPVDPSNAANELPRAVRELERAGVEVFTIAGSADEPTIAACGEAGVPVIRVMAPIPKGANYLQHLAQLQREYEALLPALEKHRVAIGVQNHAGRYVSNAIGLRYLLERFDPTYVGAVWDPAHCALEGEIPELAIDIVWSHLRLVNLKNAYWQRTNGPEAEVAQYARFWTSGSQGICPWGTVAALLKARDYQGHVCLTAEYSDHDAVERLIVQDLTYAKELFS